MNREQELKRLAMNIVSQLFDLADVPVEKRQAINNEADEFVLQLLQQIDVQSSRESIVYECRRELLKQMFLMSYSNGYPSEAVPKATVLSLPQLMGVSDGPIS